MIDPKTDPLDSAYADVHFKDRCCQLITASGARTVCEIGGGRSPLLSLDEVRALKLDYTILDVSARGDRLVEVLVGLLTQRGRMTPEFRMRARELRR